MITIIIILIINFSIRSSKQTTKKKGRFCDLLEQHKTNPSHFFMIFFLTLTTTTNDETHQAHDDNLSSSSPTNQIQEQKRNERRKKRRLGSSIARRRALGPRSAKLKRCSDERDTVRGLGEIYREATPPGSGMA